MKSQDTLQQIALFDAIKRFDRANVEEYLKQGVNPNTPDLEGKTALSFLLSLAIPSDKQTNCFFIICNLLQHNADYLAVVPPFSQPLWVAALHHENSDIQEGMADWLAQQALTESPHESCIDFLVRYAEAASDELSYNDNLYSRFRHEIIHNKIIIQWVTQYHLFKPYVLQARQSFTDIFQTLLPQHNTAAITDITATWMRLYTTLDAQKEGGDFLGTFRRRYIGTLKRYGIRKEDIAPTLLRKALTMLHEVDMAFRSALEAKKAEIMPYCDQAILQDTNALTTLATLSHPITLEVFMDSMARREKGHTFKTLRLLKVAKPSHHFFNKLDSFIKSGADLHAKPAPTLPSAFDMALRMNDNSVDTLGLSRLITLLLRTDLERTGSERFADIKALFPYRALVTRDMLKPLCGAISDAVLPSDVFSWLLVRHALLQLKHNLDHYPSSFLTSFTELPDETRLSIFSYVLASCGIELPSTVLSALLEVTDLFPQATETEFIDHMLLALTGKTREILQKEENARANNSTMPSLDELKRYVAEGIDINASAIDGKTALSRAFALEKKEIFTYLLDQGADIHVPVPTDYYETPKLASIAEEIMGATGSIGSFPFQAPLAHHLITKLWDAVPNPSWEKDIQLLSGQYRGKFAYYFSSSPLAFEHNAPFFQTLHISSLVIDWILIRNILLTQEDKALHRIKKMFPDYSESALAAIRTATATTSDLMAFCERIANQRYHMLWSDVVAYSVFLDASKEQDLTRCATAIHAGMNPFLPVFGSSAFEEAKQKDNTALLALFCAPLFFQGTYSVETMHNAPSCAAFLSLKPTGQLRTLIQKELEKQQITLPKKVQAEEVEDWLLIAHFMKSDPDLSSERLEHEGFLAAQKEVEAVRTALSTLESLTLPLFIEAMADRLKKKPAAEVETTEKPRLHKTFAEALPLAKRPEEVKAFKTLFKNAGVIEHAAWLKESDTAQEALCWTAQQVEIPALKQPASFAKRVEHTKQVITPLTVLLREQLAEMQPKERGL